MYIYDSRDGVCDEEFKKLYEAITHSLPSLYFPDYINFIGSGTIAGHRHHGLTVPSFQEVVVYYNHGIAVVSLNAQYKEDIINTLQNLEFRVPSKQMNIDILSQLPFLSPEEILWDELRAGNGKKAIEENLRALLMPILSSFNGVEEYEFAVYDPFIVSNTDDVIPCYIEYDELFRLPALGNGLVNLDYLFEKIQTMPGGMALAISSRVRVKEGEKHIPMVDFKTEGVCEEDVKAVLERLQLPKKYLVYSVNSYHHYNTQDLLTEGRMERYLDVLAQQPEIGENWPWLQARQGFSLLRIAPCAKKPFYPEIIE